MREFVPNALATGLDFSELQRVNSKFHTGRGMAARREGDVIWRVPTRNASDSDLYLLIEFQSESDWWMAVRAQVYQGLLWQQVIQEKKLKNGTQLPPLLLLVLYNGTSRWRAPTETFKVIGLEPDSRLWNWQPQVRYYLVDMGALTRGKLFRHDSLVALLFRLEHPRSLAQLQDLNKELLDWFRRHPGFSDLKLLFGELVGEAVRRIGIRARIPSDLQRIDSMLATQCKNWTEQWLATGEAKGKAEALEALLVSKFGTLSPSVRKRIREGRLPSIECWFKRALDARDLPSVFGSRR